MTEDKKRKYKRWLKIVLAIAFVIWSLPHIDHFLRVDMCLDDGNVWDDNEERCRSDCLAIIKGKGCIYMDEEFQQLFENCAKKTAQCDEKKFDELHFELCKKYQGAWHKKNKTCWFDYAIEYCQRPYVECPDIPEQIK